MADIYSFMQGFGEAQDRLSKLKNDASDRSARAAETATNLFRLSQEQKLAPYKLRGDIATSLDAERLLKINAQQDPYRVREFIAKAEDSIANYKNNAELRPQMNELARARIKTDLLNLGAGYQEVERSMANTTDERNAVLQSQGKNWKVVDEGNGAFGVQTADGKTIYSGLSEAQLTVWYNNAAKYGQAQFQTEAADFLDANSAARSVKPQNGTVMAPQTGFEAQPTPTSNRPAMQVTIPPELARAGAVGAAKEAEKANAEGIAKAQAAARASVGQTAAHVPTGMSSASPLMPSIMQTYLPKWMGVQP